MPVLGAGEQFPRIPITLLDGTTVDAGDPNADRSEGRYRVVLFYRGSWCPFCNAQLRAFQRALPDLAGVNTGVLAVSVDDQETTQALVDKLRLEFPVGHSADAHKLAELTGAFVNEDPLYVQSTGFVLGPDGRIVVSVYSSGAIGRLMPDDVVGLVRYHAEHSA
ncbi:redoxin domain-containing protein [Jatrophihabitans lederbergiae]|uniref:Redoxin domain-containing protein n=1 Tax=Jatrophihabitans lederbergiae TaxID=3075547 RepID=A0ABU2JG54_9ACTN|nr:redoxin domain-containing protein [Jatrophihabitans sp. DSM 44399]MDT0263966.1 redoxin domain-containing protein [Jatrophihabitans sp. DSM 44399]